ncbi:TetR/AcrR family transcriptional regulator [Luteibacter pinisoli]|uniref:TetR/AcrR family transcriptional regulator n=1 Tax=Luteibacter pinisoli TaxID=2589080 RepID=A0A4Y5Z2S4_9GAMM|nr:TetR/AcrR family transcriptional regulator [Luteibacter pinisoli]QDE39642.1 TetR/AcrR family transcriptional regulator [Luteibacter pinisoli]
MRYAKDHKEKTRQRIIEIASQNFRERGFEGEGIASVMQGAGLTNGAFFNHFSSKEDLAREVVAYAMAERLAFLEERLAAGGGSAVAYVESYLSLRHRDNPQQGCPIATLVADVARRTDPVREAFAAGMDALVDRLAQQWPTLDKAAGRARAIALYSLINGALQLARATKDATLSEEILAAGKQSALALIAAT